MLERHVICALISQGRRVRSKRVLPTCAPVENSVEKKASYSGFGVVTIKIRRVRKTT